MTGVHVVVRMQTPVSSCTLIMRRSALTGFASALRTVHRVCQPADLWVDGSRYVLLDGEWWLRMGQPVKEMG